MKEYKVTIMVKTASTREGVKEDMRAAIARMVGVTGHYFKDLTVVEVKPQSDEDPKVY